MSRFNIPTRAEVAPNNQQVFDNLNKSLGFVPNLYAFYAKSETALQDYLTFQNRKTSLSKKEKEVINLVVSQYNGCEYCLAAHTVLGGMNGFGPEQILEIRSGSANFDEKLNALARFAQAVVENKGKLSAEQRDEFLAAGYNEENLVDVVMAIGDKTVSNYMHNIAKFPIDFPEAPKLETEPQLV